MSQGPTESQGGAGAATIHVAVPEAPFWAPGEKQSPGVPGPSLSLPWGNARCPAVRIPRGSVC